MKTTIICNGCQQELTVVDLESLLKDELKIHVYPCGCGIHADCVNCEDLAIANKQLKEAKDQIVNLQEARDEAVKRLGALKCKY